MIELAIDLGGNPQHAVLGLDTDPPNGPLGYYLASVRFTTSSCPNSSVSGVP